MSKYLDLHNLLKGIADYLRADSVLQGADYLNGTNNIFLKRLPENKTGNNLILEAGTFLPDDMYSYQGEIQVHCLFKLLGNGQVDYRADKVLHRCEELLDEHTFSISNIIITSIESYGIVPDIFSALSIRNQNSNKSHGLLRLKLIVSNE